MEMGFVYCINLHKIQNAEEAILSHTMRNKSNNVSSYADLMLFDFYYEHVI